MYDNVMHQQPTWSIITEAYLSQFCSSHRQSVRADVSSVSAVQCVCHDVASTASERRRCSTTPHTLYITATQL